MSVSPTTRLLPDAEDYPRPLPAEDALSAPYWDGARNGKLRYQECNDCGYAQLPGARRCISCGSVAVRWKDAQGLGTVFTFTVMHKAYHPGFADLLPYAVGFVQLAEGPLVMTSFVDCDVQAIVIGQPVEVVFDAITRDHVLPRFRPTDG